MIKIKKVVDERQELELLKIEHVCFWLVFWGLCISIIVQSLFMQAPFKQWAAEWIVFMIGCVGILVGCVKKGQWDYYTKPTIKTYLLTSLIGSASFSLFFAIAQYNNSKYFKEYIFTVLVPLTLIVALFLFILIFVTSYILGKMIINKQDELEKEFSDEEK